MFLIVVVGCADPSSQTTDPTLFRLLPFVARTTGAGVMATDTDVPSDMLQLETMLQGRIQTFRPNSAFKAATVTHLATGDFDYVSAVLASTRAKADAAGDVHASVHAIVKGTRHVTWGELMTPANGSPQVELFLATDGKVSPFTLHDLQVWVRDPASSPRVADSASSVCSLAANTCAKMFDLGYDVFCSPEIDFVAAVGCAGAVADDLLGPELAPDDIVCVALYETIESRPTICGLGSCLFERVGAALICQGTLECGRVGAALGCSSDCPWAATACDQACTRLVGFAADTGLCGGLATCANDDFHGLLGKAFTQVCGDQTATCELLDPICSTLVDGVTDDVCTTVCAQAPPQPTWTCNPAWYGSGDGCDCGCGAHDPDCDVGNDCTTEGCCAGGVCGGACNWCGSAGAACTTAAPCVSDAQCPTEDHCAAGSCLLDVCPQNTTYCSGDELRQCNADGSLSSTITTCTFGCSGAACRQPSPTVSVSPAQGPRGTTFHEPGHGFTPSRSATLSFTDPGGATSTITVATDGAGHFDHDYVASPQSAVGSWTYRAIDDATGSASPPVVLTITAPAVSVSPSLCPRGTTLHEPGSGFTPLHTITLHFTDVNGVQSTTQVTTDGTGQFVHDYIAPPTVTIGPWTYYAVDDATGTASPAVGFVITAPGVSVAPTSGPRGTVFDEPGSGFTPHGTVVLHFVDPNGVDTSVNVTADNAGGFAHSYTSSSATATGTWTYYAVDASTGTQAQAVTFAVGYASVTPTVSVSPAQGPRNTTFHEPGLGFTPNSTATLTFTDPNGARSTATVATDAAGRFVHDYVAPATLTLGRWTYVGVDDATGTSSPAVHFTITAPAVSVSPAQGPRGTTFHEPGTGFSTNASVALHFVDATGTDTSTTVTSDGSGSFVHDYASSATAVGTWSYYAVDNTTGVASPRASFTVTAPTVSVSPLSGPQGTTFNEPGTGFTPNGAVTLHFVGPVASYTVATTASAAGSVVYSYATSTTTAAGTWTYYAVDQASGYQTPAVTYTITTPAVHVNPSSGQRGTLFDEPGVGFTPSSSATLHFVDPNGVDYVLTASTDASGRFAHQYATGAGTAAGTWQYYAIDDRTSTRAATITFTITP